MKDYKKNMRLALVCFLLVVVLNFFLPRLLPGNPVAYLTGFSEQDMTPAQVAFYEEALHLNKPLAAQFGFYLRSLLDGTLGYSYKKDAAVSALIGEKIGYTVRSQNSAPTYSQSVSGFKSTCAPRCPADTPISSYKIAVSSMYVGKCFFMPMGLHPPRI